MAQDEQAPCQYSGERLDALRAQPVAPIAARGRLLGVRGEDRSSAPLLRLLPEEREHLTRVFRIQIAGRLVGEYELWLADERPGDGYALQLAAGELARRARLAPG